MGLLSFIKFCTTALCKPYLLAYRVRIYRSPVCHRLASWLVGPFFFSEDKKRLVAARCLPQLRHAVRHLHGMKGDQPILCLQITGTRTRRSVGCEMVELIRIDKV
ncbi:hypothetical protein F4808DRAFT_56242 [Astrocystis sublimbata]|nr:hypothetical protein F4808DRAFT_56242 [Astrocystis sublimbata]